MSDYRAAVAAVRSKRDREIERARADASRQIAALIAVRDEEIRRLRTEDPTMPAEAIASAVGCSRGTAHEVLNPEARERYNRRRREHWRARASESSLT
jgi:hypothetical protein